MQIGELTWRVIALAAVTTLVLLGVLYSRQNVQRVDRDVAHLESCLHPTTGVEC